RVCAPGGRVVVVDTYTSEDPAKAAAFNRLEILRDPSHARSLYLTELKGLYRTAGLGEPRVSFYELRDTVTNLLARSFPNPGDETRIIDMFTAAIADDSLGIPVQRTGDRLEYAYPVAILAAKRPSFPRLWPGRGLAEPAVLSRRAHRADPARHRGRRAAMAQPGAGCRGGRDPRPAVEWPARFRRRQGLSAL